jgi:hypothetical protein
MRAELVLAGIMAFGLGGCAATVRAVDGDAANTGGSFSPIRIAEARVVARGSIP